MGIDFFLIFSQISNKSRKRLFYTPANEWLFFLLRYSLSRVLHLYKTLVSNALSNLCSEPYLLANKDILTQGEYSPTLPADTSVNTCISCRIGCPGLILLLNYSLIVYNDISCCRMHSHQQHWTIYIAKSP